MITDPPCCANPLILQDQPLWFGNRRSYIFERFGTSGPSIQVLERDDTNSFHCLMLERLQTLGDVSCLFQIKRLLGNYISTILYISLSKTVD